MSQGIGASSLREDRACGPTDLSRCASQPEALVPLRVLSLFAGIGGFDLGLERTGGFKTVAFCEIEPFPQSILRKHWPEVPVYDDVRTLTAERLQADGIAVDCIVGGFPCQDISVAGAGAGLAGERSGLWSEYARLIRELRPRFVIVENVSALLCRGLGDVLGDLAEGGYDAEWDCIPAAAVGAPHIRDRVWIVAYLGEERTKGCGQGALSRLTGVPWRENVRRASSWARRPDLPASGLCRGSDGVPARVDRTSALGNAVHPDIPELIGRAILAAIADTHPKGGDVKQAPSLMSGGGGEANRPTSVGTS